MSVVYDQGLHDMKITWNVHYYITDCRAWGTCYYDDDGNFFNPAMFYKNFT